MNAVVPLSASLSQSLSKSLTQSSHPAARTVAVVGATGAVGIEIIRIDRIIEPSGKLTVYAFGTLPEVLESRGKIRG